MFYFSLDLFDLHDFQILVKLTRNKLFKVDNFYLLNQWDSDNNKLTVYIDEPDKQKAEEQLTSFINLLNFLFDIDITITTSLYLYEIDKLPSLEIIDSTLNGNNNIKKIDSVFNKIKSLDKKDYDIIEQSIRYYSRSLKLMELDLQEDSFLTAFKPIELISNYIYKTHYQNEFNDYLKKIVPGLLKELFDEEYRDENKDKDINLEVIDTLEDILTQRRKISKTLSFLKLDSIKDEIGSLVRLRNKIGAHGNSGKSNLSIENSLSLQTICKQIVTSLLFDNTSDITKLDCERKIPNWAK